jgi:hypothetical protein
MEAIRFTTLEWPEGMSDTATPGDDTGLDVSDQQVPADDVHESIPDESRLLGRVGIEEEVLAELARAEAKLSDPSAPDDPDAAGAQV